MLKYKANETLTGNIDGVNKIYISDNFIAKVDSIIVDWVALSEWDYSVDRYTLTLNTAPTTSVILNDFYREELDIIWDWLVEFGDIIKEVYEELWRNELSKVYTKNRVISMINKSIKRITNKTSEKASVQHYALEWLNWFKISNLTASWMNWSNIQGVWVEWAMLAWDSVYVPYTSYDWTSFDAILWVDTILKNWDKAIVGHRIPYGVQKPTSILVNNTPLDFIDNQLFTTNSVWVWTIIKGKDGSNYIFLPYSETSYTLVVKYVPDRDFLINETDIVDIPYEYTTTIVYDVLYRLLLSREDDRMQWYKTMLYWDRQEPWLLKEYRTYIKEQIKKTRGKIRSLHLSNQY